MFSIAASILLAAHLLCVNLAMTGPLACVALRWQTARHHDPLADRVGRWLVQVCIVALLVAMGLGFVSGLLLWYGGQRQFFDALGRLPARRIYWGVAELAFYFFCMMIYGALWHKWRARPVLHGSIAVIAATNLMYHFPPLFVLIGWLAAGGHAGVEPISAGQLLQLMFSPAVLAPVAHHLLASVAVVGIAVMVGARRLSNQGAPVDTNETDSEATQAAAIVRRAAVAILSVTLLQLPTGLWVVLQLTGAQRDRLLGGAWPATGLFIAAMVTALGLLHWLSMIALGQTGRREVYMAALLLAVLTLLMSGVLRAVRKEKAAADLTTLRINGYEACDDLYGVGSLFRHRCDSRNATADDSLGRESQVREDKRDGVAKRRQMVEGGHSAIHVPPLRGSGQRALISWDLRPRLSPIAAARLAARGTRDPFGAIPNDRVGHSLNAHATNRGRW